MTYIRPFGDDVVVAPGSERTMSDFIGAFINAAKGLDVATPTDIPTASGGTSISAADFNSTARPGVCKATNLTALNYVKTLQKQLNRVAQVKGFPKIGVDGEIGPATLALFSKVQGVAGSQVMGSPSSCMGVAPDADVLSAQVQGYADSLGAPAQASAAIALKAPTIIKPNGQEVAEAGLMDSFSQLPTIEKLAVAGVIGGIGYLVLTRKGKRRGKGR